MWALIENNEISKVLTRPKALTIGDIQYPQNIFMLWSSEELEAIGIYAVVADNDNFKNPSYWINTDQSFDWNGTEATASYGEATPRALDDTTDPETGHITHGLKWHHKEVIKNQAYGLLQPNDWYVVRHQEAGTDIPEAWATYRSEVRATAEDMQGKIDLCNSVEELESLYQYNDAEPPARPLGEWPQSPDNSV